MQQSRPKHVLLNGAFGRPGAGRFWLPSGGERVLATARAKCSKAGSRPEAGVWRLGSTEAKFMRLLNMGIGAHSRTSARKKENMMSKAWLIGLSILVLALPAQAQRGPRGQRGEVGRGRGPMRVPMEGMIRNLGSELNLSEEQQTQYDAIADRYLAQWQSGEETRDQMREIGRQLREAREAGDTERAEQLRGQMQELAANRGQQMQNFFAEVEPILNQDQLARFNQIRERMQRRQGGDLQRRQMRDLLRRLPQELELTEEQRAAYDQMVAEQREQMGQLREQWRELQPLMRELRAARAEGNEQRVAEIEAELAEKRPEPPGPNQLLDKLMPILTEAQQAKLTALRQQYGPGRGPAGPEGPPMDPQTMLRAAKRLDLSPEQQEQLRKINREAQELERRARREPETRAAASDQIHKKIVAILNPDQVEQFNKMVAGERPDRRERGDRERNRGEGRQRRGDRQRERDQNQSEEDAQY
jgi:hypothetical protein